MDTNFELLLSTYLDELRRTFGIGGTATESDNLIEHLPLPESAELLRAAIPSEVLTHHPLSGKPHPRNVTCTAEQIDAKIRAFADDLPSDERLRYFTTWRMLPEKLAELDTALRFFPADPRIPDATVWHRADAVAAFTAATENRALLSFNLGPVQTFIATARSVRDLWSGSAILSWLTFRAMVPVIRAFGPTAVVSPSLRSTPLMDLWLQKECALTRHVPIPEDDARKAPTVPNRFLSLVSAEAADGLAKRCENAAKTAWREIADTVKATICDQMSEADRTWDRRWNNQIESFFEIRTAVLPLADWDEAKIAQFYESNDDKDVSSDITRIRKLANNGDGARPPGEWQSQVELSSRLMDAKRRVRHVPSYNADTEESDEYPPKCTLLGTYEQMGPDRLDDSRKFWEDVASIEKGVSIEGVRLRSQERFSSIALAKRFAGPTYFSDKLDLKSAHSMLRFPDTATVAATQWLASNGIKFKNFGRWSGQWLHWTRSNQDLNDVVPSDAWKAIEEARDRIGEKPPTYYAVLQMDGDHMGRWLAGEKTPTLKDVYHKTIVDSLASSGNANLLEARRPVTPEFHAAISEALTNFAVRVVPKIVKKHSGVLIYAGGDDVLALLPTRTAIKCAHELQNAFSSDYRNDFLLMGSEATVSAGIAIVHYKEDLRIALEAARIAEREAKNAGRDLLRIAALRRSGEHSSATCPWNMAPYVEAWMTAFEKDASDRWAYHLRAEAPTFEYLDDEAVKAMIRRRVQRSNDATKEAFKDVEQRYAEYTKPPDEKTSRELSVNASTGTKKRTLEEFITLVQAASFMVRGRDA